MLSRQNIVKRITRCYSTNHNTHSNVNSNHYSNGYSNSSPFVSSMMGVPFYHHPLHSHYVPTIPFNSHHSINNSGPYGYFYQPTPLYYSSPNNWNYSNISTPLPSPPPYEHHHQHHQQQQPQQQQEELTESPRERERDLREHKYPLSLSTAAAVRGGGDSKTWRPHNRHYSHSVPYSPSWAPYVTPDFSPTHMIKSSDIITSDVSHHHHHVSHHEGVFTRCMAIEMLMSHKRKKHLTFKQIADHIGRHEVWVTSAMLGEATFSESDVDKLFDILRIDTKLHSKLTEVLTEPPIRGAGVLGKFPTDPVIYRFYEVLQVYGTTLKALTHEKFGDGLMSSVNLEIDLTKKKTNDGDYCTVTLLGKFEPFKKW